MKRTNCILLALLFALCLPLTATANAPGFVNVAPYVVEKPEVDPDQTEWLFEADKVEGDHNAEFIEGTGNCSISLGENQLQADFVRYYQSTGWVFMKGNVRARWGGDFLQAEEGEFDLTNMTGWLKQGKLFMAQPHLYVEADRVGKSKGDSYSFRNAKVTACDGDTPAWSISTDEGYAELDDRIHLYRSTFNIKDVPSFYWPYVSMPGRQKRASGFLTPYLASSKRLGLQANLPYYWVVNEEVDATFYQNYMAKRGYMQGVEVRHVDDVATKGMWKVDLLHDAVTVDSEGDESDDYADDGLIRPNENRWWVRSKYDGWLLNPDLKVKLDLDIVSDQNFMRDFQRGPSGFDKNRDEFLDSFGRDIENKDDTTRTSLALLTRSWDRWGTAAKLEYVQNLAFRNGNGDSDDNTTVQTVPELEAFAFQQAIPGTPLEAAGEVKYDYFTRNYGHTGHRFKFTPEVKLPMSVSGVTLIPRAAADFASYELSRREAYGDDEIIDSGGRTRTIDSSRVKSSSTRTTWAAGVTGFTEFSRVFDLENDLEVSADNAGASDWARIKHSIVPRLGYTYTPKPSGQEEHPYFDEYDRIDGRNEVTYALINVLDRRRDTVTLRPGGEDGPEAAASSNYRDFFYFRMEQSYDFDESTRKVQRDEYERRPFSDLLFDLNVKPGEWVSLSSRNWLSFYTGELTESENDLKVFKDGLGEVWLGYDFRSALDEYKRYRSQDLSIIELGAKWEATNAFTLRGKYRYDFHGSSNLERTIGLAWKADCYTLDFSYTGKSNDNRFEVGFNLMSF